MKGAVLLECGSNSLKVHYKSRTTGEIISQKLPWRLGHDVFEMGKLSEQTLAQALDTVLFLLGKGFERSSLLAIATEALRDAENRDELLAQLRGKLELDVRVISGREEASLLAEGFLKLHGKIPAFLVDIGGGSLQIVYLSEEKTILRDSLPLGAIRLFHLGEEEGKPWNESLVEEYIRGQLEDACLMQTEEIHGTGGTLKALIQVLKKTSSTAQEVAGILGRVRKEGPPAELKPARQQVFLPGLMVLSNLLDRTGARTIHYVKIPVGRIFLERLLDRLGPATEWDRKKYLLADMRLTNVYRPPKP